MTKIRKEYAVSNHPAAEATVLTTLYKSRMRSADLVRNVKNNHDLSNPSIYAILKKLEEAGLLHKTKKSARNVYYEISLDGKRLVEEEYLKARETLVFAIRNSPNRNEIIAEALVADLLEKLPLEWQDSEKRKALIDALMININAIVGSTMKLLKSS